MTAGEKTRKKILDAGLVTWPNVSSRAVGDQAGLSHSAVLYHFPELTLRDEIARHAVKTNDERVLKFLDAENHPVLSEKTRS